jgi:hypothetical protein
VITFPDCTGVIEVAIVKLPSRRSLSVRTVIPPVYVIVRIADVRDLTIGENDVGIGNILRTGVDGFDVFPQPIEGH